MIFNHKKNEEEDLQSSIIQVIHKKLISRAGNFPRFAQKKTLLFNSFSSSLSILLNKKKN